MFKALILICKKWYQLSLRLLYRSVFVKSRRSAEDLVTALSNGKGKLTAELSIFQRGDALGIRFFPNILTSLLELLPNIRILMMGSYPESGLEFASDSRLLATICDLTSLKHLSVYYNFKSVADVSRLLTSLPGLVSFSTYQWIEPPADQVHTADYKVELPSLETLRMIGGASQLVDCLNNCSLPKLKRLNINFSPRSPNGLFGSSIPLADSFAMATIQTLDLSGWPSPNFSLDMSEIFGIFPNLIEFAFIIEWEVRGSLSHETLSRIGFYGGATLFDFGSETGIPPYVKRKLRSALGVSSAITNLNAMSKANFPRLSSVQLLSPEELHYFLSRGGTSALDESRSTAWLEWRKEASENSVLVLDCTGNEFGVKPHFDGTDVFTFCDT